jgi:uncharacterized protein YbcC (UPF0753/DUF2309 family)
MEDTSTRVEGWLGACRPKLPLQNPLWAFIHNNILLNLEDRPFHEAAREAAALYRARPYETEAFYREELARGRIRRDCLDAVLAEALPDSGPHRVERFLEEPSLGDDVPPVPLLRRAPRLDAEHLATHERALQDFVVPLIASYLDQGLAAWANPYRSGSLWEFFTASVRAAPAWAFEWAGTLKRRLEAHERAGRSLDALIAAEVREAAPAGQEAEYCLEVLFTLKGWSGMVTRLEAEPALAPVEPPRLSLKEWLAVLLVSTHALDAWRAGYRGHTPVPLRREAHAPETRGLGRLRLWQEAYERSFAGALLAHLERGLVPEAEEPARPAPRFQAMVCMDDREESFRRALESEACGVETWGAVGFFGLDMRFQAVGASRPTRQCPPVVEPSRTLHEVPLEGEGTRLERSRKAGHVEATALMSGFYASRTLLRGFVVSLALGLLSFLPLVLKVLMPGRMTRLRRAVRQRAFPHPRTRIALEAEGGYSLEEQARIVEGVLRPAGLTRLAPLVAVIGHGSTSTNNPFRQAYGCGACSGNPGAPNARAFALMANDARVRALLAARGLVVPDATLFVPCYHDTTTDTVELLDRELLPEARRAEVEELHARLSSAARLNAVERCGRFAQAPREGGEEAAAQHVLDRGHDLSQPRPEYGHNRVAACIVGRRSLTRRTFLDRRAFLVSHDPTLDTGGALLRSAVLGSVPVAVNIAMDYYFSRVDPEGFGAGSKLPLNVVSLLGVLTGSKSDLRIGLARQMVELHEPMRILVLIEASREDLLDLVEGHPRMRRMAHNGWMRLGRVDPSSSAIELWDAGRLTPWRERWPEFRGAPSSQAARPAVLDARYDRPLEVRT